MDLRERGGQQQILYLVSYLGESRYLGREKDENWSSIDYLHWAMLLKCFAENHNTERIKVIGDQPPSPCQPHSSRNYHLHDIEETKSASPRITSDI